MKEPDSIQGNAGLDTCSVREVLGIFVVSRPSLTLSPIEKAYQFCRIRQFSLILFSFA
jgi:hypothetical protein